MSLATPRFNLLDLLAILQKSLDRALFLYTFIREIRSSGVRGSFTIIHIRKFFKLHHNIVRFRFFPRCVSVPCSQFQVSFAEANVLHLSVHPRHKLRGKPVDGGLFLVEGTTKYLESIIKQKESLKTLSNADLLTE